MFSRFKNKSIKIIISKQICSVFETQMLYQPFREKLLARLILTALISIVNDVQEVVGTTGSDSQSLFLQSLYLQVYIVFKQR